MTGINEFNMIEIALTAIVGLIISLVPYMTEKTVNFGVRIPESHLDSKVIKNAKETYTAFVLVFTAILVAAGLFIPTNYIFLLALLPLLLVALSFFTYLPEHYRIEKVKKAENWIGESSSTITANFVSGRSDPFPWFFAIPGIIEVVLLIVTGLAYYPSIPAVFPTHYGINGLPNEYSAKSIISVFLLGFISTAVTSLLILIAYAIEKTPFRISSPSLADQERATIFRKRMTEVILIIPVFINLIFILGSYSEWGILSVNSNSLTIFLLLPVFVMLVVIIFVSLKTGQLGSNLKLKNEKNDRPYPIGSSSAGVKDDDLYWRGGVIYINKNDKRILVPKRFGVGYTFNMGHWGSWAIFSLIICIPIAVVIVTLLLH